MTVLSDSRMVSSFNAAESTWILSYECKCFDYLRLTTDLHSKRQKIKISLPDFDRRSISDLSISS